MCLTSEEEEKKKFSIQQEVYSQTFNAACVRLIVAREECRSYWYASLLYSRCGFSSSDTSCPHILHCYSRRSAISTAPPLHLSHPGLRHEGSYRDNNYLQRGDDSQSCRKIRPVAA